MFLSGNLDAKNAHPDQSIFGWVNAKEPRRGVDPKNLIDSQSIAEMLGLNRRSSVSVYRLVTDWSRIGHNRPVQDRTTRWGEANRCPVQAPFSGRSGTSQSVTGRAHNP